MTMESQTLNEEKKRKKIAVACIIGAMVFAAAIVGIGFALNYNGTVDNTSDDAETDYYIVQLDVDKDGTYDEASDYTDAFSGHVYYNTVNSPVGSITWTAIGTEDIDGEDCVLLGSVNVKVSGPSGKAAYDDYVLSVTHSSAISGNYKIGVSVDGVETYDDFGSAAGEGFELDAAGAQETVFTVNLYAVVETPVTSAPAAILYSGETFTFTVTGTAA